MTLQFPNQSRSYDSRRHLIRFWGYDSALEIPFFVEVNALLELAPGVAQGEAGYLAAFDAVRGRVLEAARGVYARSREDAYLLSAESFRDPASP